MLEYKPADFSLSNLQRYQGIIITSAQGVRALAERSLEREVPVYCVGDQSAAEAKACGYKNVYSAHGTAEELTALILKHISGEKPLFYARGADISVDIEAALAQKNIGCESIITYKAELVNQIPAPCVQAIQSGKIQAAAFTSVRGTKNFMRLVCVHNLSKHLKTINALCLSDNMLQYIQPTEWADARVCPKPDGDAFREFIRQSLI